MIPYGLMKPLFLLGLAAMSLSGCGLLGENEEAVGNRRSEPPPLTEPTEKVGAVLRNIDDFSLFARAAAASDLDKLIADIGGPVTLLVPADSAFDKLTPEARDALFADANRQQLVELVRAHIIKGRLASVVLGEAIDDGGGSVTLKTIDGTAVSMQRANGFLTIIRDERQASVMAPDLFAENGVLYGLDTLLVPVGCAGGEAGGRLTCNTG